MSLSEFIAAELPGLRAEAESLMTDTCTITRAATGAGGIDENTGAVTPAAPTTVYTGPCRVQRPGTSSSRATDTGGLEVGVDTLLVQLPLSATDIRRGDDFRCDAVGDVSDPDLVGATAEVRANLAKTHATKRTLICEESS